MGEDILGDAVIPVVAWLIFCFRIFSLQVIMDSLFCAR